jgi:hypothetical protein
MPSVSEKQKRFMRIAAHDPGFAKKAGISQTVAREFYAADQVKAKRNQSRDRITRAMIHVKR